MSFGTIKTNTLDTTKNASAGVDDTKASRQNIVSKANAILNMLLSNVASTYNTTNSFSDYAVHLKALAFEAARIIATSENVYNDLIFSTTRPEFFYQNIETFLFVNQSFPFVNKDDVAIRNFLLAIMRAWLNGARKSSIQAALSLAIEEQSTFVTFNIYENYLDTINNPSLDWVPLQHTFKADIITSNGAVDVNQIQANAKFLIDLIRPAHTYLTVRFVFTEDTTGFTHGPPCEPTVLLTPIPVPAAMIAAYGLNTASAIWNDLQSAPGTPLDVSQDIYTNYLVVYDPAPPAGSGKGFHDLPPHQTGQICDVFHIDFFAYNYEDFRTDCNKNLNVPVQNETPDLLGLNKIKTRYGPLGDGAGNLVSNVNQVQVFVNSVQVAVLGVDALKGIITLVNPFVLGDVVTVNYSFLRRHYEFLNTNNVDLLLNQFDEYNDDLASFLYSTVLWTPDLTLDDINQVQCTYQYQGFDALDTSLLNDIDTLVYNGPTDLTRSHARDRLNDAWNIVPNILFVGDTEVGSKVITNVASTTGFFAGSLISSVNLNAEKSSPAYITSNNYVVFPDTVLGTKNISNVTFFDGSVVNKPANNEFNFIVDGVHVLVTFPASGLGTVTAFNTILTLINSAISASFLTEIDEETGMLKTVPALASAFSFGSKIQITGIRNLFVQEGTANTVLGLPTSVFSLNSTQDLAPGTTMVDVFANTNSINTTTITIVSNPNNLDTLSINGRVITFVPGSPGTNQVQIGLNVNVTAANLNTFINTSSLVNTIVNSTVVNNVLSLVPVHETVSLFLNTTNPLAIALSVSSDNTVVFYDGSVLVNPANNVLIFKVYGQTITVTFPASGPGVSTPLLSIINMINDEIFALGVKGVFAAAVGSNIQLSLSHNSAVIQKQVVKITTIADVAGSLQNKFFNLNTSTQLFSFWFNVTGFTVNHQPAGLPGTAIEITLSANSSAAQVAAAVAGAVSLYDFTVVAEDILLPQVLTITNKHAGSVNSPSAGTSGFKMIANLFIGDGSANTILGFTNPTHSNSILISQPALSTKEGGLRTVNNQSFSTATLTQISNGNYLNNPPYLSYPTAPFIERQEQSLIEENPTVDIFYLNNLDSTFNNLLVSIFGGSNKSKLSINNTLVYADPIEKVYAGLSIAATCSGTELDRMKPMCESALDLLFDFTSDSDTYKGICPELPEDFLVMNVNASGQNFYPYPSPSGYYPISGYPLYYPLEGFGAPAGFCSSFVRVNLHDYQDDLFSPISEDFGDITAITIFESDFCNDFNSYMHFNTFLGAAPIPSYPLPGSIPGGVGVPADHTEDLNNINYPLFPPEAHYSCLTDQEHFDYVMGRQDDTFQNLHKFLMNNDSSLTNNTDDCSIIGVHPMTPLCGNGTNISEWLTEFSLDFAPSAPFEDGYGPNFPENPPVPFTDSFTYLQVEPDFSVSGFFNGVDALGFDVNALDNVPATLDSSSLAYNGKFSENFSQSVVLFPYFIAHYAPISDLWWRTNLMLGADGGAGALSGGSGYLTTGWFGSQGNGLLNETVPMPVDTSYDILLM